MTLCHSIRKRMSGALLRTAWACLAGVLLAACSSDADDYAPEPVVPAGGYRTEIRLTVGNPDPEGRATPSGNYDPGSGVENYIDIPGRNYRFLFFAKADAAAPTETYVTSLEVTHVIPLSSTASSKTYVVLGKVGVDLSRYANVKVVALANWGTYPAELAADVPADGTGTGTDADASTVATLTVGQTTIAEVCRQEYTLTTGTVTAAQPIPLYGVKDKTVTWDANDFCNLGTIHLLRAYAKIDVRVAKEKDTDPEPTPLSSVRMRRYNTRGYCAPHDVEQESDYVKNSYANDYVSWLSIPADPGRKENSEENVLPFTKNADGSWSIYLPEYQNIGVDPAYRAYFEVQFEGDKEYHPIYLCQYDNGKADENKPFDLHRNNWYRYEVRKSNLDVLVAVVPYTEVSLDPGFGLDSPEMHYIPIYDSERNNILCYYDADNHIYYRREEIDGKIVYTETINPFWDVDAGTGRKIFRNDKGEIIYYYDIKTNKYYGSDNKTELGYNPLETETDPETGWRIFRNNKGEIAYYYDQANGTYYDTDKTTPIEMAPDNAGWQVFRNAGGDVAYYYDRKTGKYYAPDKKTEIEKPDVA